MRLSKEGLLGLAETTRFHPDLLEKAVHLLHLLDGLFRHPFLKNRLTLKGGTALNLLLADLPRLSVDIGLNYVGSPDVKVMLAERPRVEEASRAVCAGEDFAIRRMPSEDEHAGGKWSLRYTSALGGGRNLEVDLNYMYRVPLRPPVPCASAVLGSAQASAISVLELPELAAGKLAALFSRRASCDLFDVHLLLRSMNLDRQRLRLAFVVYEAMSRRDWRTISLSDVDVNERETREQHIPLLRSESAYRLEGVPAWAARLVAVC